MEYPEAKPGEEVYASYDEEFDMWGVFGLDSGHCYCQKYTYDEACEETDRRNRCVSSTK